jgi:hypothetical protein
LIEAQQPLQVIGWAGDTKYRNRSHTLQMLRSCSSRGPVIFRKPPLIERNERLTSLLRSFTLTISPRASLPHSA